MSNTERCVESVDLQVRPFVAEVHLLSKVKFLHRVEVKPILRDMLKELLVNLVGSLITVKEGAAQECSGNFAHG